MSEFLDYFSAAAGGYATHRPTYPAALVEFLAAESPARERAWDAGCGSGQLSVALASQFTRVIATDASAEQIAAATAHPAVEYRRARAEASGLPDASVDLAVAAQAVHWFDVSAYQREVRRVTKPGALAALVGYPHAVTGNAAVDNCMRRFHSETLAAYWPPERAHIENGYADLPFPFEPIPVPALAIERDWTGAEYLAYAATWSAVRQLERAGQRQAFDDFVVELTRTWGDTQRRVRWELVIRAGRVT